MLTVPVTVAFSVPVAVPLNSDAPLRLSGIPIKLAPFRLIYLGGRVPGAFFINPRNVPLPGDSQRNSKYGEIIRKALLHSGRLWGEALTS